MLGVRAGLFEDNENMAFIAKWSIQQGGHLLVPEAVAATRHDALQVVEGIALGRITLDAVIMDGNLEDGATSGEDAQAIVARMKELGVFTPIIGFSSRSFEQDYGIEVAIDLGKKPEQLGSALGSLEAMSEAA